MKILKITSYLLFTFILSAITYQAKAQLTGLQAIYFENQYLANPAMAGMDKGLNLYAGYQAQWTTVPGGPRLQNYTADYNAGNKVGLGFTINSDQSGLISRTRIMGTYAYHLQVSEAGKLNFGISVGVNDSYIDYSKINGDQSDVNVALFNQRRIYFDGDLGIAYTTNEGLNLQVAVPNLGSALFSTNNANLDVDRTTFFTAASYRFPLNTETSNFTLEPKVVFRGVKGFTNMGDFGANLMMQEYHFNITTLYHTNKSVTAGVGFDLKPIRILFSYTSNYGPLSTYADNTFEFGLKYALLR
jgi:type IX secretion system PorP/SprF family membrane protein